MKLDFKKDAKRNVLASGIFNALKLVFPFLNRTLFLWLLGPEYLGLNGLFTSILGVLMLAELGFGTAVICSLYKPVADDNKELFNAYLCFYRMVYRCVGTVIFAVGLCLLPFLRNLIHGHVPEDINIYVLYLIHLLNTSASYFLFAYRGCILGAHNRTDVLSHIRTLTMIGQYISVFFILYLTRNYYFYIIATVLFTLIQNILIYHESRRLFPELGPHGNLPKTLRDKVISEVKSIILHKIGAVISHQIANLVISAFLGLTAVATYGNYYYVVTSVSGLIGAAYASMNGGFGNKIHTESKEENFTIFMQMCHITQVLILWCTAVMFALFQPFIQIWAQGNPNLIRHTLTPILMVLFFYVNMSRQTLLTFKSAAALWKQDRWKPILSGIFTLAVSITLVKQLPEKFRLDGVILAPTLAYLIIQVPWESRVVFSHFFEKSQLKHYWNFHLQFITLTVAVTTLTWLAVYFIKLDGIPGFLLKAGTAAGTAGIIVLALFHEDAMRLLHIIKH